MRKIDLPLGSESNETTGIVNKEEPAKKKRKTKDIEPDAATEAAAPEAETERSDS